MKFFNKKLSPHFELCTIKMCFVTRQFVDIVNGRQQFLVDYQFHGTSRWKQSTFNRTTNFGRIIFSLINWEYRQLHRKLCHCAHEPIYWRQTHYSLPRFTVNSKKMSHINCWKFTTASLVFIGCSLVRCSSFGPKMYTICMHRVY